MKRKLQTITIILLFPLYLVYSPIADAQNSENRIFYIESGGDGFTQSIKSVDLDHLETTQLWNSAATYTSGYYIAEEDSVLLFNNSILYKTDREFQNFHELLSLPTSFGALYTAFLPDSSSVYYTFNTQIRKLDLNSNETTTVISVDGDIEGIAVSNSGTIYWAENFGFGNRAIQSYTTEGDTLELHTLSSGRYESVLVDSNDETLYFVQDNFGSYVLNRVDLETGDVTSLHSSSSNFSNLILDESANKLYMMFTSDRQRISGIDLTDVNSPEEIYSGTENIAALILDEINGSIFIRTLDGVFDFNVNSGESTRLTIPAFYSGVLVADPANEYLYFVTEGTPHEILRTDFTGTEFTRIKEFDVFGTTFKRAHFDAENNDLYIAAARRLYRMNLDDEEGEETIITLDFGNSIEGFDIDLENEVIYYYQDRDGIYKSDLNGEGYERISSGLGFGDSGIAYNPDLDKIYFSSSTWIYSAESDGTDRENYHDRYDGYVPDIQYNQVREQIIFIDRSDFGTDRLRFRNIDETADPLIGVYFSAPSISSFAAILSPGDTIETSAEQATERPISTKLNQNFPNPFNPSTVISYQIETNTHVVLDLFDMTGRKVATLVNENQPSGSYEVPFDGSQLSSGIYLYRLTAGQTVQTRKMSLIK